MERPAKMARTENEGTRKMQLVANQVANCDRFIDADEVPIFDFIQFEQGPTARKELAMQIGEACEKVGFFMIKNHGILKETIQEAFDVSSAFFAEPVEEKEKIRMSPDYPYGYEASEILVASLGEKDKDKLPDLKETFNVCLGPKNSDPHESMPEAKWPEKPESVKIGLSKYYRALEELSPKILHLFAIALELPEDFFVDKMKKHISALRTLHYPALADAKMVAKQMRASEHTDYGAITILADNGPGLQVLKKDNEWLNVIVPADHYVINLGDLMARWTNDKWRSTLHRVVNLIEEGPVPERQSMAYFCNLSPDAIVDTIETCITADNPDKYESISAGSYLMKKHRAAMGQKMDFTAEQKVLKAQEPPSIAA